jgi:hypothetical protein
LDSQILAFTVAKFRDCPLPLAPKNGVKRVVGAAVIIPKLLDKSYLLGG